MKMLGIALSCYMVSIPFLSTGQEVYGPEPFDEFVQVPFFLDNGIMALSKISVAGAQADVFEKSVIENQIK